MSEDAIQIDRSDLKRLLDLAKDGIDRVRDDIGATYREIEQCKAFIDKHGARARKTVDPSIDILLNRIKRIRSEVPPNEAFIKRVSQLFEEPQT